MQRKNRFFFKKYPRSDYAIDLKFKKDLIKINWQQKNVYMQNIIFLYKNGYQQLIRLKIIVKEYDKTFY